MDLIISLVGGLIRMLWIALDAAHHFVGWALLLVVLTVVFAHYFETPSSEWFPEND